MKSLVFSLNSVQTDYTFVIMGWVPKKQLKKARKMRLKEAFEGRVIVNDLIGT